MRNVKDDKLTDEPVDFRPFESDAKEIEKRVRMSGKKKPDLIREIIKAGLYHLQMTEARLDPTHRFAKTKTIEALQEAIKPTSQRLDQMTNELAEIKSLVSDGIGSINYIDRQMRAMMEEIKEKLDENHRGLEEVFRQILVQRGILHIYLLAYRAGTVFEKEAIPEMNWIAFVNESIKLTAQMASDELLNTQWKEIENKYIPNLAKEIFELVRASRPKKQ